MTVARFFRWVILIAGGWLAAGSAMAQGAGPNTNILTPVGMKSLTLQAQGINSNFRFGQTLIGEANFDTDAIVASYAQRFRWFDRFAMFGFSASYLNIDAHLQARLASEDDPTSLVVRQSGLGDPTAFLRWGLVGAPALDFEAWRDYPQGFQLYAQAGVQAPWGAYSDRRFLNTGFNRWAWDLSLPMAMPLERARRRTFLELTPRYIWFGDNDDPPGSASVKAQSGLFLVEANILHHLTGKSWVGFGIQYQSGGETRTDGDPDGNGVQQWYGELSFGHAITRRLAMNVKWGRLFEVENNARGSAVRLGMVIIL